MISDSEITSSRRVPTEHHRSVEARQIVDLLKSNHVLRRKLSDLTGDIQWLLPEDMGSKLWNADYVDQTVVHLITFFGEPNDAQLLSESLGLSLPVLVGTNDELRARNTVNLVFAARDQGKADALAQQALEKFLPLLSGATAAEPTFHPVI